MRVAVIGATGNLGTSVIQALADDPDVDEVVGIARRRPELTWAKTTWATADISRDDLSPHLRKVDAVVLLAWLIQPARDLTTARATNVEGSARVLRAVAEAKVKTLAYASSVGAYSPGPKDRAVDESWPTEGIPTSFYSRHKAEVESILDRFEQDSPKVRVARIRPGLVFKRAAASGIRRLFAGPLLPSPLVRPSLIPLIPDVPGLRFQAVHSYDVGEVFRLAVKAKAKGAFNVAADPVLDPQEIARTLGARTVPIPASILRAGAAASWKLRLQPTPPGWLYLALGVPIMDITRAREELGWQPRFTSARALLDLLGGMRDSAGLQTPPLRPDAGGPMRMREFATGVGRTSR